jgi:hypothetical protein
MLYLYLDESSDLVFDFFAKKPSKFAILDCFSMRRNIERQGVCEGVL